MKTNFITIRAAAVALLVTLSAPGWATDVTAPGQREDAHASLKSSAIALRGHTHGGRQPIAGAEIFLYAAGTTGYKSKSNNLLTSPVYTDSHGLFNLDGNYSCTPGQQLYLVALGGDTGGGINPNAALLTVIGDCATVTAATNVEMNEATTVASIFAVAGFLADAADLGAPSANLAGLAGAFRSVNKLANLTTGTAGGSALPPGATMSVPTLNTLADVLAACVNTQGGTAGDGTVCGRLFSLTTSPGGMVPTNIITAALNIARNPSAKVSPLFSLVPSASPFLPTLAVAPPDWALSVTYTGGKFLQPSAAATDDSGNIWITNVGNNTVSLLTQMGAPVEGSPFSGNGLDGPAAIAIDGDGHAWIANQKSSNVSVFDSTGSPVGQSPIGVGTSPAALAFDSAGRLWVANAASDDLSVLTSSGVLQQTIPLRSNAPTALVFDPR